MPKRLRLGVAIFGRVGILILAGLLGTTVPKEEDALALPQGAEVQHGEVSVESIGDGSLQITASDQAIIQWGSFDIAPAESVHFIQPASTATALNRVVGGYASQIAGTLTADGLVFLVNYAGIVFASTAVVEVGGLVASTLEVSNHAFLARSYQFLQPDDAAPGMVVNHGALRTTQPGGLIALLGGAVENNGIITARLGTAALASGSKTTLTFEPDGEIAVVVDEPTKTLVVGPDGQVQDGAVNAGQVIADGGTVLVTAHALEHVFDRVVNQTGVVEATSVVEREGRIFLAGEGGLVEQTGVLRADGTAQAPSAGDIEISGSRITQQGILSANATTDGQAGQITLLGQEEVLLTTSSRIEATGGDQRGTGGSVLIHTLQGNTAFRPGAVVNVSGGQQGGDAGFIELSGETLQFGGQILGAAQDGFLGGRLLVDPLNIVFNTTTQPAPPNNPSPTADIAFSAAPTDGTTTVQIADIVGFKEARFEATQDITVDAPLTMNTNNDVVLRAGRHINLNADVRVQGTQGDMTLTADAAFAGLPSDGLGTITQAVGTSILAGNGTVTLQTGGDLTIRTITTGTNGTVSITSTAGNVLDDGSSSTRMTTDVLTLIANASGKGVGTTGALNTDINTLNLDVGSGGATIRDMGSFTLNEPTVASGGSLEIRADTNLTIASSASVSVSGSGTLTLVADDDGNGIGAFAQAGGSSVTTAGGSITISGADDMIIRTITASTGNVSISGLAGSHIKDDGDNTTKITGNVLTLSAGGRIGDVGDGQLDTSVNELDATASAGSIFLTNDKALTVTSATASGSGNDITIITTSGNLNVGLMNAADDLTLTAAGAIEESPADSATDLVGDLATLTAATGIGAAGAIETTLNAVSASVTGTGAIQLAETDAITLTSLTTADGALTVTSGGAMTATLVTASGSGRHVTLTTTSGNLAAGTMTAADDTVSLTAAGSITDVNGATTNITASTLSANASTGIDLDTEVATITASTSGTGTITLDATDAVTLSNLSTANGSITVTSGGAMTAASVTANGSGSALTLRTTSGDLLLGLVQAADDLTLTAGGAIEESGIDEAADLSGDAATLTASSGIGASGTLESSLNSLTASVTGPGAISLSDTDGLTLTNVSTTNGAITVSSGGTMHLRIVDAAGAVTLTASGGGSILGDGDTVTDLTATSNSSLTADGTLGTATPLTVRVSNGSLTVRPSGITGTLSVNLNGSVAPINTLSWNVNPPGKILLNGVQLYPPIPDVRTFLAPLVEMLRLLRQSNLNRF